MSLLSLVWSLFFEMYIALLGMLTIFLWSSIIESSAKEIEITAHPVHFLHLAAKIEIDVVTL